MEPNNAGSSAVMVYTWQESPLTILSPILFWQEGKELLFSVASFFCRVRGAGERLQQLEREAETRAMQHSIQVDDLRLTVQNLESALRVERKSATEEK